MTAPPAILTCCVDGCQRTRRQNKVHKYAEWLCPKHWKMVDPWTREKHKAMQRRLRKIQRRRDPLPVSLGVAANRWQQCKDDVAMKMAMGLTDGRHQTGGPQ